MRNLFAILISLISIGLNAQDIHFSQFTASPLNLNPALTGLFNADFRVVGNYRSQWASVTVPYRTYSTSLDFGLLKGNLGSDVLGVGLIFYNDVAGDSEFSTTQLSLSLAYQKSLGNSHFVSVGLQGGMIQRKINYNKLQFGSQFDGEKYNETLSSGEVFTQDNFTYMDALAGLLWFWAPGQRSNIYAGIALPHVNRPNISFMSDQDKLYRKLVIHSGSQHFLKDNLDLLPSVVLFKKGPSFELNFGSYLKFLLQGEQRSKAETSFYIGAWFRISGNESKALKEDAFILSTKMDYKRISLGFSYDINVSELQPASNYKGGPEISLIYLGWLPRTGGVSKTSLPCLRI